MKRHFTGALILIVAALIYAGVTTRGTVHAEAMAGGPTSGFTVHIDADQHFGANDPNKIVHHWCKTISKQLTECQLYDSDAPNAKLVGVETIVPVAVWKTFPSSEQALWHYHKTELKKIHATMPGMSAAQQAKMVAAISETYGKVWILWDPGKNPQPVGQPSITILK